MEVTLVNADTGEIVQLGPAEARRLTDDIKVSVAHTWELVVAAYQGRAWTALDYGSWDEYCAAEFEGARIKLPREDRREVVGSLREAGMSTRAIGSALGVSDFTVRQDMPGARNLAPAVDAPRLPPPPEPQPVTGLDGKTYTPPPPRAPKRPALTDDSRRAGHELRKAADRITRIIEDDRFHNNKEQVALQLHGHLLHTLQVCQDALELITTSQEGQ